MDKSGEISAVGASAKMSVSDNNNSVTSQVDSSQNSASVSVSGKSSASVSVESDKSTASSSANTNQASQKVEFASKEIFTLLHLQQMMIKPKLLFQMNQVK